MPFGYERMEKQSKSIVKDNIKYVDVFLLYTKESQVIPKSIVWENGITYEIDKILDVSNAASLKAGGSGLRYKCLIQGKEKLLWFDSFEQRWFVETKG